MPSAAATASPPSLDAIEHLFVVDDVPAVRRYLSEHPFLVPLLVEAHRTIPRYFPGEPRIRLQLLPDRDDRNHVDLFAIIQTPLPEDRALEFLDQLDESWWLDAASQARGRLTIDVESES